VLLVRHGSAGDRALWEGDDRERPLDERGLAQAVALAALLSSYPVDRILTSPAVRCLQTIEPLAKTRGLEVEAREELSEEHQVTEGAALVSSLKGTDAVICGHGGLEQVLREPPRWKKGAVFVVGDALEVVETLRPKV
jgi:phosphohistidine phosphatase SixA